MSKAGNSNAELIILEALELEAKHQTCIFPEDTDETITFTADAVANTFGAWAEIVDNNAVTLSSKFAAAIGHISGVTTESASVTDKAYLFEIAYGAAKNVVSRGRIISGSVLLDTTQQIRVRGLPIPAGETVYYRMKCETGGATITVSLRHHLHS